jgi:hypothetical protein
MIQSLQLDKFTVFQSATFRFGKHLNIIAGENGTGKTHVLKALYSGIAASAKVSGGYGARSWGVGPFGGESLESALAAKFQGVFGPDRLGNLVRRGQGKARLRFSFADSAMDFSFSLSGAGGERGAIAVQSAPSQFIEKRPVYLPTRELLTVYPGFVSLYETTHLPFEETWRDTCLLLGAPLVRGEREKKVLALLAPLEAAMGGRIVLDQSGRFSLHLPSGPLEVHLVAEGLRKLGMVAQLIANASLLGDGYLFWDEPEANLNPRIVKGLARSIFEISQGGVQVFVATHSLFLLRELYLLHRTAFERCDVRYFGLHSRKSGSVQVKQGVSEDDMGDIASLDEELLQSDRYLNVEMGFAAAEPVEAE